MADLRLALVGATGLVGRTLLSVLEERSFPAGSIALLASRASAGKHLQFKGEKLVVGALDDESFEGCDIAFFSAGASVSREQAPRAAEAGAVVVDNSSAFRMDPDVPLVVPEVNGDLLDDLWRARRDRLAGVIANPNCSTAQMVVALAPLHRAFGLESVVVSTYQSVSGTGTTGLRTLEAELDGDERASGSPYAHRIAHNVLPHIDALGADGWSGEERKMINETRRIMRIPTLHVVPTTVRVPVRVGHSEAVYARFSSTVSREAARTVLASAPGVEVIDEPMDARYPLAIACEGRDEVFVGRIRVDPVDDRGLALWVVADNLRKGAATNAVQIAEVVLERNLVRRPEQRIA
jgi:aspartate-semialdehyde dehydrogenase